MNYWNQVNIIIKEQLLVRVFLEKRTWELIEGFMHLVSWEAHLRTKKSESYHCPLVAFSRVGLPTAQRALACLQFRSVRPGLTRARQAASHEQLHWRVEETGPSSFSSAPQRAGQAAARSLSLLGQRPEKIKLLLINTTTKKLLHRL